MDSLVPMTPGILFQSWKDYGQYDLAIFFDQVFNVIIIPQE